jgi:hypothetical protein
MPTYYCPNDRCGAAIKYSVVKPERCPKCGKLLKGATVVAAVSVKPTVKAPPAPPPIEDDDAPLLPRPRKGVVKVLRQRVKPTVLPQDEDEDDTGTTVASTVDDDEEDETYDKRAARRLARELLANLDPDAVHVSVEKGEDDPISFGELYRQRQAAAQR